jgi:outer membrane protein assembly factor BamD
MTCVVFFLVSLGCSHAEAATPHTNVDAKPPDTVLFERAMGAMKNSKYFVARALLENLINSYPDSDYVPGAKLSIGDAWYAQGAFQQAEAEYRDFTTFFPPQPGVAKAQLRLDSIRKKSKNLGHLQPGFGDS